MNPLDATYLPSHTSLAEFHVQLMVTFPFTGPQSIIEFHSIGKSILQCESASLLKATSLFIKEENHFLL